MQSLNHREFHGSDDRPYSPPLSDVEEDEVQHIVIHTFYDPRSPQNRRFKAPRNRADNAIWSENERARAEVGKKMKSISDLRNKVCAYVCDGFIPYMKVQIECLYHKGVKRSPDAYLRIPMEIIPK